MTARAAAIARALPKMVPPVATRFDRSPSGPLRCSSTAAISSVMPQAPNGSPPAIDLPAVIRSGSSPHCAVSPPGPTTCVCVSSQARSVPVSRVRRRSSAWKPSVGQQQPDVVRDRGLREDDRDRRAVRAPAQGAATSLNGTRTVPATVSAGQAALLRHQAPVVVELDKRLVEVAVVLAVEHEDLVASGDDSRHADGLRVRVGRRARVLPLRQPEAPSELLGHDDRVLGGQQELVAAGHLPAHARPRAARGRTRRTSTCRRC